MATIFVPILFLVVSTCCILGTQSNVSMMTMDLILQMLVAADWYVDYVPTSRFYDGNLSQAMRIAMHFLGYSPILYVDYVPTSYGSD